MKFEILNLSCVDNWRFTIWKRVIGLKLDKGRGNEHTGIVSNFSEKLVDRKQQLISVAEYPLTHSMVDKKTIWNEDNNQDKHWKDEAKNWQSLNLV